jgi:hypothetical protein
MTAVIGDSIRRKVYARRFRIGRPGYQQGTACLSSWRLPVANRRQNRAALQQGKDAVGDVCD